MLTEEPPTVAVRATFWPVLAAIAILGFVSRLVYAAVVDPPLAADATWYVLQAGTIAGGHGFIDPGLFYGGHGAVATANFPPLWPTVLAGVNTVWSGGISSYRHTAALLGTGTIVLTALLGRRLLSPAAGLAAAVVVAASPALIATDGSLMAESLFTLLMTASLLVAYVVIARPRALSWLALGVLLGAAALTRADALVVAPVLIGVVGWRSRRRVEGPGVWLGPLTAVVVLLVVVAPWAIRDSDRLGGFVAVSTNAGSLLEGSNCDATYGGAEIGTWDHGCMHLSRRADLSEHESNDRAVDSATDYMSRRAVRLATVVAPVRVLRGWGFWSPSPQAHVEAQETRDYGWQLLAWGFGLVLTVAGVVGAVVLGRRGVDVAPLVAILVGATFLLAMSWGNSRFRVIADPALAVLAVGGVAAWRGRLSVRRG